MPHASRTFLPVASMIAMSMLLAGCNTVGFQKSARHLPAAADVVPAPAPRPAVKRGDDARVVAAKGFAWGEQNAKRLGQAHANYERVKATYAAGSR